MKHLFFILFTGSLLCASLTNCKKEDASSKTQIPEEEWILLFNGKDLEGWKPKIRGRAAGENWRNTFRVADSALRVDYSEYEDFDARYGHLFFDRPFSSYILKLRYRFTGEQVKGGEGWATKNSGVMIHTQPVEQMSLEQEFPVSLEVQLLGGVKQEEERPTANLCTPGTHVVINDTLVTAHCIPSSSPTFYGEEWIDLEVRVWEDSLILHFINGKEVMRYRSPIIGGEYNTLTDRENQVLSTGYIALQSESHPIEFKDIRLKDLENERPDPVKKN